MTTAMRYHLDRTSGWATLPICAYLLAVGAAMAQTATCRLRLNAAKSARARAAAGAVVSVWWE
jgi:hypothetical protein